MALQHFKVSASVAEIVLVEYANQHAYSDLSLQLFSVNVEKEFSGVSTKIWPSW